MRITVPGVDLIKINEENYMDQELMDIPKIHLIKFCFSDPTDDKIECVIENFPNTNRFIVDGFIRIYNNALRYTNKKYYVENSKGTGLVTFFRRNNKVLLNTLKCNKEEKKFIFDVDLWDILKNIEIMVVEEQEYEKYKREFSEWRGNLIIHNEDYEV